MSGYLKKALIREEGYPIGQPAPMYLECVCGHKVKMAEWGAICFQCRREYDSGGWIIGGPEADPIHNQPRSWS